MKAISKNTTQMKSALFIDFDNIYITLENQDKQAAEKFATNPDRWLGWLERQLPMNYPGTNFTGRSILIRRCYLNPNSFSEYRPQFIRTACEVVDCPPLTAQGKTSTDIHMVMDMLDALGHDTYFDEFIVFSGDADFTPVLLKIRKHARFSAVLSVGYSSPAYRAACDQLIKENAFLEMALGINYQDDDHEFENNAKANTNKVDKKLLKSMADRVHETAVLPTGIPANDLPAIYKEFSGFTKSSHWLGYKSLRRLTQAVVELHKDLVILEDEDSWSVARQVFAGFLSATEKGKTLQADTSLLGLRDQVTTWLKNLVGASPTPIALNVLAQSVLRRFGDQDVGSGWLGAGTFKNFLQQLDLEPLLLSSEGPSYLYDPKRHSFSADEQAEEEVVVEPANQDVFSAYPELAPLAKKIHRLTDMPYLTPEHYAILFSEIAREVNDRGYKMTRTSRAVRDQCIEHGAPIARSHVNFVLTGLYYIGYRLGANGKETPERLGEKMVENTISLCRTAQFELNDDEKAQVTKWLLGAIK